MIHEHEATEIASAAMDFTLAPSAGETGSPASRTCSVCAERRSRSSRANPVHAGLPVLDASDATRHHPAPAAMTVMPVRSPMMLLVAAALLLAMLLGVAAAAGAPSAAGRAVRRRADAAKGCPRRSMAKAAGVDRPGCRRRCPGLRRRPSVSSIVVVVGGNLRVRSEPRVASDSILHEPLLRTGDRLFVVEGPVPASDYDWYRVAPIATDPGWSS